MRFKKLYIISAFIAVMLLHYFYTIHEAMATSVKWINDIDASYSYLYFSQGNYFMGLSYALGISFSVYAFLRFIEYRKTSGIIAGLTLPIILYAGGCFLIGCCGSPMLVVYIGLFGSWFLKFTKPLAFLLTLTTVSVSYIFMKRKFDSKVKCKDSGCNCHEPEKNNTSSEIKPLQMAPSTLDNDSTSSGIIIDSVKENQVIEKIHDELKEAISLKKCKQCGCMNDALNEFQRNISLKQDENYVKISKDIGLWKKDMEKIKYSCLGCDYCYPAVATNLYNKLHPDEAMTPECSFEIKENKWPYVAGEYFVVNENSPIAVSTLSSIELAEKIAQKRPNGLSIIGKTETENIGIDKVIKNIITNNAIRHLILAGKDPKGHETGKALLSLKQNGVDSNMKVIGSTGKRPILRNVSLEEIELFREQVNLTDMIGCEDENLIINKIATLKNEAGSVNNSLYFSNNNNVRGENIPIIEANQTRLNGVEMDKAGYFVIIPVKEDNIIIVEHYTYDNKLSNIIKGGDSKSIYLTIVQYKLVTQLSHAAYLGRELEKAELSMKYGFKYRQDGAGGSYYEKNENNYVKATGTI